MVDVTGTLGDLIASGANALNRAGVAESRREAFRLWSGISGVSTAAAVLDAGVPVDGAQSERFFDAIRRRSAGEPLAYIAGQAGFRHLVLQSDRRALIPRPETEGLVDAALARARTGVAADIGTGTGAIALALRGEGEFDEVFGIDQSPEALQLARANGVATGLPVTWLEGDLVAPLAGRSVDLLVSNPPYVSRVEYDALDPSVRDYEPAAALLGGADGQQVVRRLFDEAPAVMAAGGWIAVEVDCQRAGDSAAIATAAGWRDVMVLDDLFGRARYVLARRGSAR